jgi:hypothetical protein
MKAEPSSRTSRVHFSTSHISPKAPPHYLRLFPARSSCHAGDAPNIIEVKTKPRFRYQLSPPTYGHLDVFYYVYVISLYLRPQHSNLSGQGVSEGTAILFNG